MKKFRRIFLIVIDSLGIGEMPDAADYGDVGADTLGHISERADSSVSYTHLTLPTNREV